VSKGGGEKNKFSRNSWKNKRPGGQLEHSGKKKGRRGDVFISGDWKKKGGLSRWTGDPGKRDELINRNHVKKPWASIIKKKKATNGNSQLHRREKTVPLMQKGGKALMKPTNFLRWKRGKEG